VVGKIVWQDGFKIAVLSDKFLPGTTVQVKYKDKITEIQTEAPMLLETDTVLMVNKDVFKSLGGDPDKEQSIDVVAKKV
jgi:hypothetical protein